MSTITTNFREIDFKAKKSGKCTVCGKRRTRQKKFRQTLNPFNKNEDGTVKSVLDIQVECFHQAELWKKEPINCCTKQEQTQ